MPKRASPNSGVGTPHDQAATNLSALIDSTEDFVWSVDLDFRLVTFNRAVQRYYETGFGVQPSVGMRPEDLLPPSRSARWIRLYERTLKQGSCRSESIRADGRNSELTLRPIVSDGKVVGISVFGTDITERKASEEARALLASVVESSNDAIHTVKLDGTIASWNRGAESLFGYPAEEIVGKSVSILAPPGRGQEVPEFIGIVAQGGVINPYDTSLRSKNGQDIDVSLSISPIRDADGKVVGASAIAQDIRKRKLIERELQEAERNYRDIFDGAIEGMFQNLADGKPMVVNRALARMLGYDSPDEFVSTVRNVALDVWKDPEDRIRLLRLLEERGAVRGMEYQFKRKDGTCIWVSLNCRLAQGADPKASHLQGFLEDVTERKQAEMELRESEQRYRATFEQAAFGIAHSSFEGKMLRCNSRFAQFLGYTPDEVLGITVDQMTAPEDRAAALGMRRQLTTGVVQAASIEKRYIRKDGSLTWGKVTLSIQHGKDGSAMHFIALIEDINSLKAAEESLAKVQDALRLSEERYRTAFQTSLDAVNINRIDDGTYVECNKAFLEIIGFAREEIIGHSSLERGIWVDRQDRQRMVDAVRQHGSCRDLEAQFRRKNGEVFWGLMSASEIEIGGVPCVLSISRDISNAKASELSLAAAAEALRLSEERYRKVFQTSLDSITISRTDNQQYIDVNQAFLDTMGFERDEVIGRTSLDLNIWTDPRDLENLAEILTKTSECQNVEIQFRKKSGETCWGLLSISIIEINGVRCELAITRDVSNAKKAEDEIRNLAFYDPLTGLPNRRLLMERLQQAHAASNRTGRMRALLFVDLDNFKTLNDTLGHQTGDLLLQEAARRLAACVRDSDTVGRLGGDEFVLMLEDLSEIPEDAAAQAKVVGEKILATITQPYLLDGRECRSSASIGISVFGDRRESTNVVLQQADIAMYQAKAAGRNTLRFFAPALQAAVNVRAALEEDLRQAIQACQFVLYYQPQIDRNRLVGAEALLRWHHPWRNILCPGEFIPLAEENGLILPIGKWVLEAACAQIAKWAGRKQSSNLSIAVNISARQFRQPEFVEQVLAALDRAGANPGNLRLELTESMLVENVEEVIEKMRELKSHGLRFSLDDFGTGYSSLAYLKRLPLDQLKIDRSFIRDILVDESSAAIAQTIISLSRAMGLPVIAEGVETEEQREFLARIGCHAFQGYLFSRPAPLDEFERQWLPSAKSAVPVAS